MKKLMITLGVAVAAIAVNAAAITWSSGTVYLPDEDGVKSDKKAQTGAAGKNAAVTAYLWVIDQTTYNNLLAYVSGTSEIDVSKTIENVVNAYKGKEGTAQANKTTSNTGAAPLKDTTAYNVGDTAYAAILYETTANSATGEKQYLGNLGANEFASSDDVTIAGMAVYFGGGSSGTNIESMWTEVEAVPEPFSGALALLGMGAIALRRKMKKAKKA